MQAPEWDGPVRYIPHESHGKAHHEPVISRAAVVGVLQFKGELHGPLPDDDRPRPIEIPLSKWRPKCPDRTVRKSHLPKLLPSLQCHSESSESGRGR